MADAPAPGPIFGYTAARSLEAMDRAGVARAMLSCPVPFGDDPAAVRTEARVFCREANEFGAKLVADHKGRFGLLAALPMIDVDGSLREIEYAFDTLGADGVGLGTELRTAMARRRRVRSGVRRAQSARSRRVFASP